MAMGGFGWLSVAALAEAEAATEISPEGHPVLQVFGRAELGAFDSRGCDGAVGGWLPNGQWRWRGAWPAATGRAVGGGCRGAREAKEAEHTKDRGPWDSRWGAGHAGSRRGRVSGRWWRCIRWWGLHVHVLCLCLC